MRLRKVAAVAAVLLAGIAPAVAPAFAAPAHPTTVHAVADSGAFYHG